MASKPMPGSPRKPAISAVTQLMGNRSPVNPETEFRSHRHRKPQPELRKIYHSQWMGASISRSSMHSSRRGRKRDAKFAIMASV